MSDDLVEKLRDRKVCSIAHNSCRNDYVCEDAAEHIEAQAARIAELEAALANARRDGMEEAAKIAENCEYPWVEAREAEYEAADLMMGQIAIDIRAALAGGKS